MAIIVCIEASKLLPSQKNKQLFFFSFCIFSFRMHVPYLACPHFELELFSVIGRDAGLWSFLVWDRSLGHSAE